MKKMKLDTITYTYPSGGKPLEVFGVFLLHDPALGNENPVLCRMSLESLQLEINSNKMDGLFGSGLALFFHKRDAKKYFDLMQRSFPDCKYEIKKVQFPYMILA